MTYWSLHVKRKKTLTIILTGKFLKKWYRLNIWSCSMMENVRTPPALSPVWFRSFAYCASLVIVLVKRDGKNLRFKAQTIEERLSWQRDLEQCIQEQKAGCFYFFDCVGYSFAEATLPIAQVHQSLLSPLKSTSPRGTTISAGSHQKASRSLDVCRPTQRGRSASFLILSTKN